MNLLESLAAAVHGASAVLNLLGIEYNRRKRNWVDVAIHGAGFVYHVRAVIRHSKAARS